MTRRRARILHLLAAAGATAAIAATATAAPLTVDFTIGEARFHAVAPDGYCLPSPEQLEESRLVEAADPSGMIVMHLIACPSGVPDFDNYVLVSTFRDYTGLTFTMDQVAGFFADAIEQGGGSLGSPDLSAELSDQVSEVVGERTDIQTQLRPMGRDDTCVYLGGLVLAATQYGRVSRAVGMCATAIGGKVLFINRYGTGNGTADLQALLPLAKEVARGIEVRPN